MFKVSMDVECDHIEDTGVLLHEVPNACLFLHCIRLPEGADKLKKEYLSGFDVDNAAYRINIGDLLDYNYDKVLENGKTMRVILGPGWFTVLEHLAKHGRYKNVITTEDKPYVGEKEKMSDEY